MVFKWDCENWRINQFIFYKLFSPWLWKHLFDIIYTRKVSPCDILWKPWQKFPYNILELFVFWAYFFSCHSWLMSTDEWWISVNPDVQGWLGCVSMLIWNRTFRWWYYHLSITQWSLNSDIYYEKSRILTSDFITVSAS